MRLVLRWLLLQAHGPWEMVHAGTRQATSLPTLWLSYKSSERSQVASTGPFSQCPAFSSRPYYIMYPIKRDISRPARSSLPRSGRVGRGRLRPQSGQRALIRRSPSGPPMWAAPVAIRQEKRFASTLPQCHNATKKERAQRGTTVGTGYG